MTEQGAGQEQSGGDNSVNYQAGNSITVHGVTAAEAQSIALDVFHSNSLTFRETAQEVAIARAEKVTKDFLDELFERNPKAAESLRDPDMQRSLFRAQEEYACSGDEDLEAVLIDLLVDRAEAPRRELRTMVLNEAIVTAPKLTAGQRAAIGVCFLGRYTRSVFPVPNVDAFYAASIARNYLPFVEAVDSSDRSCRHIEYVRAGSISLGEASFGHAMLSSGEAFFTHGYPRESVNEPLAELLDTPGVFVPCIRNSEHVQLNTFACNYEQLAEGCGRPDLSDAFQLQDQVGRFSPEEARAEVIEKIPALEKLADSWDKSQLKNMTLTSVGLAIGHGYYCRTTGTKADLGIWV
jgi:hypothetical protein